MLIQMFLLNSIIKTSIQHTFRIIKGNIDWLFINSNKHLHRVIPKEQ